MFDLYEEFKALVSSLNERGIDYAVCGGLAMAVWGAIAVRIESPEGMSACSLLMWG